MVVRTFPVAVRWEILVLRRRRLTRIASRHDHRAMRRLHAWWLLSFVAMGCVYADAPKGRAVSELRDLNTEEAAFVTLINNYRASMGAGPLVATRLLNQVAYDHSLDMGTRRFFDHVNPDGLSPFDRMTRAGYTAGRAENIAAGNAGASATFTQWRNSAGHNRNMLDPSYRAMGIGRAYVAGSPYGYYWTNVFGAVVDSTAITGSTPTPTPTACVSNLTGSGTNGGSGARCLSMWSFNVEAGRTYTISTCGQYTGDPWLVVSGACACTNDDTCGMGSECTCTATATGVATLCASTYQTQPGTWNYSVTATNGGRCSLAGSTPPPPPDAAMPTPADASVVSDVPFTRDGGAEADGASVPDTTVPSPDDAGITGTPLGGVCTASAQCADNLCIRLDAERTICSRACTDDCGCPSSYRCARTSSPTLSVCVPGVSACGRDASPTLDDAGPTPEPTPDPRSPGETVVTAGGGCATTPRHSGGAGVLAMLALLLGLARLQKRLPSRDPR